MKPTNWKKKEVKRLAEKMNTLPAGSSSTRMSLPSKPEGAWTVVSQ
jgi:hypothetical protein